MRHSTTCSICKGLDQYGEPSPRRELKPNSKFPECQVCRASMNSWVKRPPSHILNYRTQLRVRATRMEHVADRTVPVPKKKTNVIQFKRSKRRAAA